MDANKLEPEEAVVQESEEMPPSAEPVWAAGCEEGVPVKKPQTLVDKIFVNFFAIICFSASITLMVLISAATFIRYILQGDLYGYDEWAKLVAMWLYFMGAAYGAYNESHVSADLVVAYIREGIVRRSLIVLKDIISVGVCALYLWYGYDFLVFAYWGPLGTRVAIPMTAVWRIPMWIYNLAIFSGLAFMTFYFIKYLLRDLFLMVRVFKGEKIA